MNLPVHALPSMLSPYPAEHTLHFEADSQSAHPAILVEQAARVIKNKQDKQIISIKYLLHIKF